MRSLLAAVALIPAFAFPQSTGEFDRHVADVTLLQIKEVQKELKITEAQRAKMNKFADSHRSQLTAYETKLRAEAQRTKKQVNPDEKILGGYFQTLRNGVYSVLTATQLQRLRQLTLQRSGLSGLLDTKVAKRVGVNDTLLKKLRETYAAGAKRAATIEQATLNKVLTPYKDRKPKDQAEAKKLNEEIQKKMQAEAKKVQPQIVKIQNETRDKMLAMLSTKQKADYQALQGKPFSIKPS